MIHFIWFYYIAITQFLEKFVLSSLLLFIRLWMAKIFWYSGLTKISSWSSTIALFKYEYKVPFIYPELAAYLSASCELTCPIFLALGLATRLASIPMLIMAIVIQVTYLQRVEHLYWMMLLTLLICYGPGRFSIDYFIKQKFKPKNN